MTAACIGSTDCIELISVAGVLNANPIIALSPCNGLKCGVDGMFVIQKQMTDSVTIAEAEADVAKVDGEKLVQTGSITYTVPDCGDAVLFVGINWGTVHVTELTDGSDEITFVERIDTGGGFVDNNYGVLMNNGTGDLTHAWPGRATLTTGAVAAALTQTITVNRVAEITSAGGFAHIKFRAIAIYVWTVQPL